MNLKTAVAPSVLEGWDHSMLVSKILRGLEHRNLNTSDSQHLIANVSEITDETLRCFESIPPDVRPKLIELIVLALQMGLPAEPQKTWVSRNFRNTQHQHLWFCNICLSGIRLLGGEFLCTEDFSDITFRRAHLALMEGLILALQQLPWGNTAAVESLPLHIDALLEFSSMFDSPKTGNHIMKTQAVQNAASGKAFSMRHSKVKRIKTMQEAAPGDALNTDKVEIEKTIMTRQSVAIAQCKMKTLRHAVASAKWQEAVHTEKSRAKKIPVPLQTLPDDAQLKRAQKMQHRPPKRKNIDGRTQKMKMEHIQRMRTKRRPDWSRELAKL